MGAPYKPLKIYKASAGSGKTYALAKEYVKILIRNPSAYRQILAITFTKKATAEMKSRILKFLQQLRDGKDAGLREAIVSELKQEKGFDPSPVLEKNAGEALTRILHDYAHFQVATIDSFFQHIIRSFAKELGLPIGMTVELDTDKALDQCVDALMEDYERGDGKLSAWLEQFAFSKMDEAKGWKIERNLMTMSRELVKEHYLELLSADGEKPELENYEALMREMKQVVRKYQDTMQQKVTEAREGIENNSIDTGFYMRDSVRSFLKKAGENDFDNIATVQKMISGEQQAVPKSKVKDDPLEAARMEEYWEEVLRGQFAGILQHHESNLREYNTARHILRHIYALALMDLLAEKLKTYREAEHTLLISDASHIIGRIAEAEASPFIFEKTGTFLRYLLIDEFQDTSQMQWKGLLPMVLEIISQGTGLSLIVGDPKQSIYRWRGGKMELLLKQIDTDLQHFRELKEEIPLNTNYRSAPEIIAFNNAFFEALKGERNTPGDLFQLAYHQHEQQAVAKAGTGYVDIRWLTQEKDGDDVMLAELLAILRETGQSRTWKEICILVRRNQDGVNIARFLSEHAPGIPFISGESLLVNSALSVKLVIAAMEYVQFPDESFYRSKFNYLYAQYFDSAKPEEVLKQDPENYFWERLGHSKYNLDALQQMTLEELLPEIVRVLELDTGSDAYLLRLQDIVFEFVRDQELSVAAFLEHWKEQCDSYAIQTPEDMEAVTISTVHKAKGLEYPVVIIPYLNWSLSPKSGSMFWGKGHDQLSKSIRHFPLDYQRSLEQTVFEPDYRRETELGYVDIMNVLYVAFTRAKETLYVLCKNAKHSSERNLSSVIKNTVQKLDLPGAVTSDDRFTFGNLPQKTQVVKKEAPVLLPAPRMRDYREQLSLRKTVFKNESIREGDILHELLALAEGPESLQKAARQVALQYGLSANAIQEHLRKAEAVFGIFRERKWQYPHYRLFNERTISSKGVELRPDRVMLSDEDCVIIDYKTGAPDPKYITQMQQYQQAYGAITGKPVHAFLFFTRDLKLQEV